MNRGIAALAAVMLLLLAACGDEARAPRAVQPPEVAWMDANFRTQVLQDDAEGDPGAEWEPYLWLPNGDLFVHTAADSSGMGIYRPETGKFVTETDDEWGDAEFGLDRVAAYPTADNAILRIEGTKKEPRLAEYDLRLAKQDETDLPDGQDGTLRRYRTPVRVGDTTFIVWRDVKPGPYEDEKAIVADGVLRLEGEETSEILSDRHIARLVLSSDAESLLAVATARPNGYDEEPNDYGGQTVLDLDPSSGKILDNHGAPSGYEDDIMEIERVDKVNGVVGAQISVDCTDFGESTPPPCKPIQTWRSNGSRWSKVAGTEGREVYWQSSGARISWTHLSEEEAMRKREKDLDGPLEYDVGGMTKVLAPAAVFNRVVTGSLLKP